jgi:hypothetical protein
LSNHYAYFTKRTQFITAKRSEDGLHVLLLRKDTPKSTFLSKAKKQTQNKPNQSQFISAESRCRISGYRLGNLGNSCPPQMDLSALPSGGLWRYTIRSQELNYEEAVEICGEDNEQIGHRPAYGRPGCSAR